MKAYKATISDKIVFVYPDKIEINDIKNISLDKRINGNILIDDGNCVTTFKWNDETATGNDKCFLTTVNGADLIRFIQSQGE
jgi:hypothetical protein